MLTPRKSIRQTRSDNFFKWFPQSWRGHAEMVCSERFVPYLLIALPFWLVCIVESVQKIGGQNLDPRFWMFLSILVTLYGGFSLFRLQSPRQNFSFEQSGPEIDEVVDQIRSKGGVVYHGSGERGLNADYLVVGPAGIHVIETKARNVFGSRAIDYRNENELLLGGKISDNQPLKQARAAAQTVREQLPEPFLAQCPVKPLVVFLGNWQINQPEREVDVAVMNASDLSGYLNQQQAVLTSAEVAQICLHLEGLPVAARA
jgi:nuclease-like protein